MNISSATSWLTGITLMSCIGLHAQSEDGGQAGSCESIKAERLLKKWGTYQAKNADLDLYDVTYHKLDLSVTNTSTYLEGKVTTRAIVSASQMDVFVFELHPSLTADSVKINGTPCSPVMNGNYRECALPAPIPQSAGFTAEIWYHGTPSATGTSAIGQGISTGQSPSWGNRVMWTLSQPYSAYEWWPCKQNLADKIDSLDVWLTVGDSLKAGSNGVLTNITPMPGNKLRFEWAHRYPIDYYLISMAVAKYVDYSFYAYPEGNADSVLIQNFIYDNPATLAQFQGQINLTKNFMEAFSTVWGPYPFENEKYGHCMAPFGGGMEHQTMTSQGSFNFTLTAHELAHQWFGNKVTCGSWKDIWLNEGFASYGEYLAYELVSPSQAADRMNTFHASAMEQPGGSVFVDDTSDVSRIFSSRLTYRKGAALVHMIRFLVNNDALFFQGLRNYLQQFAFGTATATDLKSVMENTAGIDLTNFFTECYYGEGYPVFSLRYKKSSNGRVYLKIIQTTSMPTVTPLFHIPVEIRLLGAGSDTTVRVMSDASEVFFDFAYSGNVTAAQIDPNQWILNQNGSILSDNTLETETTDSKDIRLFPNPTEDLLLISGISDGTQFEITDSRGKIVQTGTLENNGTISVLPLRKGPYVIRFENRRMTFIKK
jgi:aminopeptidase N